jgi:GNAT superfamily N-acetyltransferase
MSDRQEVQIVEGDFEAFFSVPFTVYPASSPYVSPMKSDLRRFLDRAKNPLFREHGDGTFFTARRGAKTVGRIVAHVHEDSNRIHGFRRGYFGYFDCADDPHAATALLTAAEQWNRDRGMAEVAGNFNLTAMQQMGVVTDGFDALPYTDMQYNPPHIPRLLEANGYKRFFQMLTIEIDLTRLDPETFLGPRERALLDTREVQWVPLRRRTFRKQLGDARRILNEGFAHNPMFVPLTDEEFLFQAQEMMWIVDDRIAMLAYEQGEAAGIIICIPDLNRFIRDTRSRIGAMTVVHYIRHVRNRRRALLVFAGVRPAFQKRGLSGALMYRLLVAMKAAGYESLGITWVSDENAPSLRQVEKMGGRPLHRLHLFRKAL